MYKINYPELTMSQLIEKMGQSFPDSPAYDFYGKKVSYKHFNERIDQVARALYTYGIKRDDAVTVCMPNTPRAIDFFYAINMIGAVANMIHPLSAEKEIEFYLTISKSRMILVPDMFYEKVDHVLDKIPWQVTVIVTRMQDELPKHLGAAYALTKGRPYLLLPGKVKPGRYSILYNRFIKSGRSSISLPDQIYDKEHTSVILYSGGTSGIPKGICLTDYNFNALAMECEAALGSPIKPGIKMLSCMPMFHGFGLGINIHTILIHGACCVLMPVFGTKIYAQMLKKKRPNYIAGVPTIFEALLHLPELDGTDLSFLMGMFCGGDSLSIELKKKIDEFLKDHGASIQVREGYGLTECVTASCLTPRDEWREGSIGIPLPDMEYAIVTPGTDEVVPPMQEGEIILTGPTLMLKYLDNEEETKNTLRKLPDGKIWLYTGDLGAMDEDGFVYFRQRIKRMIITNGYNVYPSRIENVIDGCEQVSYSCVIGVKDHKRMHRVRAYVVLKDGIQPSDTVRDEIMERLKKNVAGYAIPKEIIFRDSLPKTLVGKVAYRLLEEEAENEAFADEERKDI